MFSSCVTSIYFRDILLYLQYSFIIFLVFQFKATEQNFMVKMGSQGCKHGVLRARHKSCFLRPDSGPCRADIIQWYFDARQRKCYEFFWGGCQGNGNRFETKEDCYKYCRFNSTLPVEIPFYCELPFEYGSCFGHYERWHWDKYYKVCKRRIYSGCGGNQNNFQTLDDCRYTCLTPYSRSCNGSHPSHLTKKPRRPKKKLLLKQMPINKK